jgi:hypothetical protein
MRSEFDKPRLAAATLITSFTLLVGGASLAMGQAETIDTDGDGMVSFSEMLVLMPALSEEEFLALDADADGLLSTDEIGAAQEAGLIPAG